MQASKIAADVLRCMLLKLRPGLGFCGRAGLICRLWRPDGGQQGRLGTLNECEIVLIGVGVVSIGAV
jgi:hypothetical protein